MSMVGLFSKVVRSYFRREPGQEAACVFTIDQDRADHGAVLDDPMDDARLARMAFKVRMRCEN